MNDVSHAAVRMPGRRHCFQFMLSKLDSLAIVKPTICICTSVFPNNTECAGQQQLEVTWACNVISVAMSVDCELELKPQLFDQCCIALRFLQNWNGEIKILLGSEAWKLKFFTFLDLRDFYFSKTVSYNISTNLDQSALLPCFQYRPKDKCMCMRRRQIIDGRRSRCSTEFSLAWRSNGEISAATTCRKSHVGGRSTLTEAERVVSHVASTYFSQALMYSLFLLRSSSNR